MCLFNCLILLAVSFYSIQSTEIVKDQLEKTRAVIIGDFGEYGKPAVTVAKLVNQLNPDFIVTLGDNNYPHGEAETIDNNIGRLYSTFIYPYKGEYPTSSITTNRFFPCLGNHDIDTDNGGPYFDYFGSAILGSTGRTSGKVDYYDFIRGPIHFFCLDSCRRRNGGSTYNCEQIEWFKSQVALSSSPWKIVFFHHPIYSSKVTLVSDETGEDITYNQNYFKKFDLPFKELGIDLVLSGHCHVYERFMVDGLPYIINGLGGAGLYKVDDAQSCVAFTEYGAMEVCATCASLSVNFITHCNDVLDSFILEKAL